MGGSSGLVSGADVVEIGPKPAALRQWLGAVWSYRAVLWMLARKDFQVRYKRASLGVAWAVAVPLLQATVLALVFSRLVRVPTDVPYAPFVFAGMLSWSYFSGATLTAVSSIVDGANLTDKVWFPRAVLPIVPCLTNLVGFAVSLAALLVIAPLLGAPPTRWLLVLVPATMLLVAFTVALGLVLSALDVYFRDVKFLVTAALLVWIYVTPVLYPKAAVGRLGWWLDFNPMTGIVALFHLALLGPTETWHRAVTVTGIVTLVLVIVGVEAHRRYDRLFVDLL